jgi:hypothetical protein
VLRNLNSEQLEGALFLLVTLHDSQAGAWAYKQPLNERAATKVTLAQTHGLGEQAISEIFDKLSEICSSLRTVTKRYKSGEWMSGALEIIEELRQHLRMLDASRYDRQALVDRLKDLIETTDNCVDCLGG